MNISWSRKLASLRIDPKESGLVGAWDFRIVNGVVPDKSGNGNTANIVSQSPSFEYQGFAPGTKIVNGNLNAGTGFNSLSCITVSFWFRLIDVSVGQDLLNKYESINNSWGIEVVNNEIYIVDDINNAADTKYETEIISGVPYHIAASICADTNENKMYLNGTLVGSGSTSDGNWSSYGGNLIIGARNNNVLTMDGTLFEGLKIFDFEQPIEWVQAEYDRGKSAIWATKYGVEISSAAITAGHLENSPFRVIDGSFEISNYSIEGKAAKVIECITAGKIYMNADHYHHNSKDSAYGNFECWIEKVSGHTTNLGFANQQKDNTANGYGMQILTDGTVTVEDWGIGSIITGGSITPGILAKLNLTRNQIDGLFEGFVNDISFGTGTNSAIDFSYYTVFEMGAGDKIVYADFNNGHAFLKKVII